ncbi:MAG: hypothetical protein WD894_13885 [Pirellulales bacterium]
MNRKDFQCERAGRIIRMPTDYLAFVPSPQPPPIEYTAELALLLSQADAALSVRP